MRLFETDEILRKRSTHCKRGHEFNAANTGIRRDKIRFCKECDRERKRKHVAKQKATKEWKAETICPTCGVARTVVATHARRLAQKPNPCRSCSRKIVRGRMTFAPAQCTKCGKTFSGRSGSALRCDDCAKREPRPIKSCPVCGTRFVGYKSKTACSSSCLRRLLVNGRYFGGRMFNARGWKERICQCCGKQVKKGASVHHVFGHPNHDHLVLLCMGCHGVISRLAGRKNFNEDAFMRLCWFSMAQRNGFAPDGSTELPLLYKHAAGHEQPHTVVTIEVDGCDL